MDSLYADIPGQPGAIAALEAAAARPVHAYLFVGPAGTGKLAAAARFAAALLAPPGPEAAAEVRRRVLAGVHPDVVVVEREGQAISIDTAREVARLATRSPVEGPRKVLILPDFHLVREAGPALLKTIEEPPPSTVFLVLAEHVPAELATIASRCVRVDFAPLPPALVVELLVAGGVEPGRAAELAEAAGGRLDRARLLAADPAFEDRRRAWREVPDRLDGTAASAAALADHLVGLLDQSVSPLQARQAAALADLEDRNRRALEVNGRVGRAGRAGLRVGVREMEERHRREVRRQRNDELRAGLAVLARAYRDRAAEGRRVGPAALAVTLIDRCAADLAFNPGEASALLALLLRLGRLAQA